MIKTVCGRHGVNGQPAQKRAELAHRAEIEVSTHIRKETESANRKTDVRPETVTLICVQKV